MPRGKSARKPSRNVPTTHDEHYKVEFINVYLSSDDKDAIREVELSEQDMFYQLERWVEDGYKVSLSIDFNNTGGILALTGKRGCRYPENENKCLVSRGPDIRGAIVSALYKIEHFCPDGVFPKATTFRGDDYS